MKYEYALLEDTYSEHIANYAILIGVFLDIFIPFENSRRHLVLNC